MKTPRASRDILAQLREFDALFPGGIPAPPPGDLTAEMQCQAWKNQRLGLERELAAARSVERAETDASAPGEMASAPFFTSALSFLQRFLHLGPTGRGRRMRD